LFPHTERDKEHWDDPEESSGPSNSGGPSISLSAFIPLEFSDPCKHVDDKDEDRNDDLEEELNKLGDLFTSSELHEGLKIVKTKEESEEYKFAHQAEKELDVSGVLIEQVEDVKSSLNAEHETPDEADHAYNDTPHFLSHLLPDLWEQIFRELHEEINKSEDGVDSQAKTHGEEDHSPEVLSLEQSNKGGEHHKEELWSRFSKIKHSDSCGPSLCPTALAGYMSQESEDGQRGIE
jgi:hypothetical protein